MKQFWMKNKVLLTTLCAVLALGVIFWGGLRLFAGNQMQDALVRTSAAEAETTATPAPQKDEAWTPAEKMPLPTSVPAVLPVEQISAEILGLEWKYRSVLPRISNTVPHEAKSWKEGEKVEDSLAVTAITRTGELYEQLLGRTLDLTTISVTRYVDEKGYRPNVLRLTDEKNDFVCVLVEENLSPVVADNAVFSASEKMDLKRDGAAVAEYLGTAWTGKSQKTGSTTGRGGKIASQQNAFELSDGRWVTLAYTGNTLHGIQVHANEICMDENVSFPADITMSSEVVSLVAPQNFVQGDINSVAEGDMTLADVTALYRFFLSAANGRASERREAEGKTTEELDYNLKEGEITYYLDRSGARENYYHIHNDYIDVDIAAKSGYIVRADCNELYNPDPALDLRSIDYDHMGGTEYFHYVRYVAEQTWGRENVKSVDVNAVYDGNYCTIDPYMTDGRWYEFFFEGGMLTEIQHFASERSDVCGWAADSLYVNTVTGEEFYQEW